MSCYEILENKSVHQRTVRRLLYLTMTKPNFSFVVQALSQHILAPKQSYMDANIRVIRYIRVIPGLGLLMTANGNMKLTTYYDLD